MESKAEVLDGQLGGNVLQLGKNKELFKSTTVEGTPFNIIEREGKHFITLGKFKVSLDYDTHEQAETVINNYDYFFLINVMFATVETIQEAKQAQSSIDNQNQQQQ